MDPENYMKENSSNRSVSDMDENETIDLQIKEYCDSDNVQEDYVYDHTETESKQEITKTKFAEWLDDFNVRLGSGGRSNPYDILQTDSEKKGQMSSKAEKVPIQSPTYKFSSSPSVYNNTSKSENFGPESYISPGQYYPRDTQRNSQNLSHEYFTPGHYNPPGAPSSAPPIRMAHNTSTPYSPAHPPFQRYQRNINLEAASEKCKYLRKIRLQIPNDKASPPSRIPQRYSCKRNSPSNLKNVRSAMKQDPGGDNSPSRLKYHRQRFSLDSRKNDHSIASSSKENNSGNSSLSLSFHSARSEELHSSWEYNSLDSSQEDSKIEVEPVLNSYQLIGDSLLVRFAEQILRREVKLVHGTRTIGLCVSGQKLMDLLHKVSMKEFPLIEKVIVLIGTNDILQNTAHSDMCGTLKYLLEELLAEAERVVLLTIPPIPKLQEKDDQWDRIDNYNTYIKSLEGGRVAVADIHALYLEEPRKCKMELFEKFYFDGVRKDLIHLNKLGLTEIYNFLTTNKYLI